MLLKSDDKSSRPGRLRAALDRARATYREYSGADDGEVKSEEVATVPADTPRQVRAPAPVRRDDPDVYLDVPTLQVDEIELKLDELKARVALEARVLDLLTLNVGVDAELRGVDLDIKGVKAEALLKVKLDN